MSFSPSPFATISASTISRGAPRSFGGWAFQRIAALDLHESPGLLAEIASRSALVRQAIFATISLFGEHNSTRLRTSPERLEYRARRSGAAGLANWSAQPSRSTAYRWPICGGTGADWRLPTRQPRPLHAAVAHARRRWPAGSPDPLLRRAASPIRCFLSSRFSTRSCSTPTSSGRRTRSRRLRRQTR